MGIQPKVALNVKDRYIDSNAIRTQIIMVAATLHATMADEYDLDDLLGIHKNRSKVSRRTDEALKAEKAPDKATWVENPNDYDWPGIDTPGQATERNSDVSDVDALEADKTVYRVKQQGLAWVVENESSLFGGTTAGPFKTKDDAIQAGRRMRGGGDVLIIEREDGSIQRRIG